MITAKFKNTVSHPLTWHALLVLVLGIVYVSTLLPGIGYHADSAEFQFVGRVLGIPHATGYPTYILLNHLFTRLFPFGSLAYRANLLSALFSIAASLVLFRILRDLFGSDNWTALVTALIFGLTPTLWSQSIVAEVHSLHILFVSVVLYFFIKWNKTGKERDLLAACAFYALSFGNHLLMVTLLPAVIYLVIVTDRKVFTDTGKVGWVALFILVGALQYSYFFLRMDAPYTTHPQIPTTDIKTFLWYVTGAQFKAGMFQFSIPQVLLIRIPFFLKLILKEFRFLIPVAVFGLFVIKNKTVNIFLLLCFLGNVFHGINYNIHDIHVYFITSYLITAIYLGIGLEAVRAKLPGRGSRLYSSLLILLPAIMLLVNYERVDQHDNRAMAEKTEFILETVEKDAVIISPDWTHTEYLWYYLIGEGMERHNIFVTRYYGIDTIVEYMEENKPFRLYFQRKDVPPGLKVYCIGLKHEGDFLGAGYRLLNAGDDLYRVER